MSDPVLVNGIGFATAGLVLMTFSMRSMIALRWVAIASNLAPGAVALGLARQLSRTGAAGR